MTDPNDSRTFWRDVWAVKGGVTPLILPRVLLFGVFAEIVFLFRDRLGGLALEVGPVEVAGGALVLLIVLRTNAGYDRWYEGRKLWGGIVNQTRNLAVAAVAYGAGADRGWRDLCAAWTVSFAHATRRSLRGETELPEVARLVGADAAASLARADHMPSAVALKLAVLLREGVDAGWLSPFAFLECEHQRALLVDHMGGCERILKTPLPLAYVIKVRGFVFIYLLLLPFALVDKIAWASPLLTMLVAFPILGLDQIAVELENPFSPKNLNHLPLDAICETIERNVLALRGVTPG